MLAREAATLDVLSGGRFEWGIGAGWRQQEYAEAGLPYDPAEIRLRRLEEALHILQGYFAAAPFSYAGQFYRVGALRRRAQLCSHRGAGGEDH